MQRIAGYSALTDILRRQKRGDYYQPSLFSWNDVEARSDLDRFYLVRDNLPDEKIVMELKIGEAGEGMSFQFARCGMR